MDDREREWLANRIAEMLAAPWDDLLARALRVSKEVDIIRLQALIENEWERRKEQFDRRKRQGPTAPALD